MSVHAQRFALAFITAVESEDVMTANTVLVSNLAEIPEAQQGSFIADALWQLAEIALLLADAHPDCPDRLQLIRHVVVGSDDDSPAD